MEMNSQLYTAWGRAEDRGDRAGIDRDCNNWRYIADPRIDGRLFREDLRGNNVRSMQRAKGDGRSNIREFFRL